MKYLIVGLGNIGNEYENTRHNIGFKVLDQLAQDHKINFELSRQAMVTSFKFKGRAFHLIKPTTYMNLSGKAVRLWMQELSISLENVLVVVDDIALPFATLRMRQKGSAAGHNGLKNIEELLGTQEYARLRFGVGDDFSKGRQADYVLSNFKKEEEKELPFAIHKAVEMILSFGTIGISQTMTQYNK